MGISVFTRDGANQMRHLEQRVSDKGYMMGLTIQTSL